jgi:hypothetical protein
MINTRNIFLKPGISCRLTNCSLANISERISHEQ